MRQEWKDFTPEPGRMRSTCGTSSRRTTPPTGDESFLQGPPRRNRRAVGRGADRQGSREAGGVLDMDTRVISTITSHSPGYLDESKEKQGFQTDKPLQALPGPTQHAAWPLKACEDNGYHVDPEVVEEHARPTTRACSTPTPRECAPAAPATSSPPARCLWPRPHHQQLPPRGPVRRGPADRGASGAKDTRVIMYSDVIREWRTAASRSRP